MKPTHVAAGSQECGADRSECLRFVLNLLGSVDFSEALIGDLLEKRTNLAMMIGTRKAALWYWTQAFRSVSLVAFCSVTNGIRELWLTALALLSAVSFLIVKIAIVGLVLWLFLTDEPSAGRSGRPHFSNAMPYRLALDVILFCLMLATNLGVGFVAYRWFPAELGIPLQVFFGLATLFPPIIMLLWYADVIRRAVNQTG